MDTLYIVIPAYNEKENIGDVVREWYPVIEEKNEKSRLVIIDDGSKDTTYKLLCDFAGSRKKMVVLTKASSGHGVTVRYGYQ